MVTPAPQGLGFVRLALLALWCALLFGWNLGGARALTWHEIHLAGAAKQMLAEGNWWLPRIGDHYWLEKPLLPYWATMLSYLLLGVSETAARLPFLLAGVVVASLIADLSARWFGRRVGLLAGLLHACSAHMLAYARLAESDMMLAATTVGGLYCFARWRSAEEPRWRTGFWLCVGLANWSKGFFFGDALLAAPLVALAMWNRDPLMLRRLWWMPGAVLALALLLAWPAAVWLHAPEALALWKTHLFDRATGAAAINNEPWWYYLVQWPWQLAPGTAFLLAGWRSAWRRTTQDGPERFLMCWLLAPLVLLSIPAGKHHHYLIHALPAAAPLMALGVLRWAAWLETATRGARASADATLLAGALALSVAAGPWRTELRVPLAILGAALLTAGCFARRQRPWPAFGALAGATALLVCWAHQTALPQRDPSAADRAFLQRAAARIAGPAFGVGGGKAEQSRDGGAEVARYIFQMPLPVQGVWHTRDLPAHLPPGRAAFVLARVGDHAALSKLGATTLLDQSERTRMEASPADRHALFRLEVPATLAARPR